MNEQELQEIESLYKDYKFPPKQGHSIFLSQELLKCIPKILAEVRRLNARETNLRESAEIRRVALIRGVALEKAEGENQRLMEEIKRLNELEAEYNKSFTIMQQENQRYKQFIRNGVELGYIAVPDIKSDPAYELIQRVLKGETNE